MDLPDELFAQTKIAAAVRRTTTKNLIIEGLRRVLEDSEVQPVSQEAIARMKSGYHLSGKRLAREQVHDR